MSTHLDTPHSPPGRGDGSGRASEAAHSADIADMMAIRAEAHAGRANGWAGDAKDYADIAETYSGTAGMRADRAAIAADRAVVAADRGTAATQQVRNTVGAIAMLALGVVLGCALTIVGYLAVVRIVHDTVGTSQERIVYDTRTAPPDSPMPSEKDAGPGGSDVTTPGRDAEPRPR